MNKEKRKVYKITFNGYRRDKYKEGLPEYSGIYVVYRCVYNSMEKTVTLKEIIYIGKSNNIKNEVCYHARRKDFLEEAKNNETLCYTYANVSNSNLDIVENALIFAQKPRLNENLVDNYNHETAQFLIEGKTSLFKYTDFKITND